MLTQPENRRRQTGERTNAQLREIKKRSEIEAEVVTKENDRVARDMDEVEPKKPTSTKKRGIIITTLRKTNWVTPKYA